MNTFWLFVALLLCAQGSWAKSLRVRVLKAQTRVDLSGYGAVVAPLRAPLDVRATDLTLNGRRVPGGELRFLPRPEGDFDVIVAMPVDEYLAGVIPAEMPMQWPTEALKAQAIAARSFALRQAAARRGRDFDLEATVFDQVHRFAEDLKLTSEEQLKLKKVLRATAGQILRDEANRVLPAFYSADCGCRTEDPRYVWGPVASVGSVRDPSCRWRRPRSWSLTLPRQEMRERLLKALDLPKEGLLRSLHVGGRSPSGRVSQVVAQMDARGQKVSNALSSQAFRALIGFDRVLSTDFSLQWLGDQLHIRGQGVGHGVGLCQQGARLLAQMGSSYRDILKLYFPRARLSSL